ncbi:pyridoxal phosphate-dependent aminotransferase [Mucisphaera sp.]|uniref:pyridoxal phosphate-dependent aminotransferase n=1 Tax=Mucisphaera sp. TaxID=2913024 RepID=UPI003D121AE4
MIDPEAYLASRVRGIDASGIRRVFDLAAKLENPINLSIGQPHFDVPEDVKRAATAAIEAGFNRYTQTQGVADLIQRVELDVAKQFPGTLGAADSRGLADGFQTLITSGVSGGLMLLLLACCEPGDDVLMPDPYFVMYRHLVTLAGGNPVFVDTYPDFQLTAERVEKSLTAKTKLLMFSSPSNPTGVVLTEANTIALAKLAEDRGLLLVSDEIYDRFVYDVETTPSVASHTDRVVLLRGFSKTYGMTGWRLGYAVGPTGIVEQMTKLQQYSFVCAPSMAQAAGVAALEVDIDGYVAAYRERRDRVEERLGEAGFELATPGGAFYAFAKVPEHLGLTGTAFAEKAVGEGVLVIPGSVFSERDTHIRLSYACGVEQLEAGLDVLVKLGQG